jgi:16S rRNA (guanine527-N7)-methyltransferase
MKTEADPAIVEEISAIFRKYRLRLEEQQADAFAVYLALLERWNKAINLTSIRNRTSAIQRHFAEPAMAMELLGGAGPVILCVGSGAGIPGLPFKILERERDCILVEANGKKATFMREVVDALELEGVRVLEGRFEELLATGELEFPVHVLTARAWRGWGGLLGLGARLMVPGGRAVVFVGEDTLRALRRYLSTRVEPTTDPEWSPAAQAGWSIRHILNLPHLDRGYAVSLEMPQD